MGIIRPSDDSLLEPMNPSRNFSRDSSSLAVPPCGPLDPSRLFNNNRAVPEIPQCCAGAEGCVDIARWLTSNPASWTLVNSPRIPPGFFSLILRQKRLFKRTEPAGIGLHYSE
jgi:hypothetical protein